MRQYLLPLLIWWFMPSGEAYGQQPTKKAVAQVVSQMAGLLEKEYVFADQGRQLATKLRQHHASGAYDKATDWPSFATAVTTFLQAASHDGHLYVRVDPQTVKELRTVSPEPASAGATEDPFFYGPKAAQNNYGFAEVDVLPSNIGYIRLSEINFSPKSADKINAAMTLVANTRALVLDLRDNRGGGSAIGPVLESYFLPANTPVLAIQFRNAPAVVATTPATRALAYEGPLYILVNRNTFSAAEALAFPLQARGRAVVVGQASGGGAHMNSWYPLNDQLYFSVSTGAPTLPGTRTSWEQVGVQPNHVTAVGEELDFVRRLLAEKGDSIPVK